jgi:UDP-glucose 4-epimerase
MAAMNPANCEARNRALSNQRCLVLGGGGFLGTHLCNAMVTSGADVQAFGRSVSFPEALDDRVVWTAGDFTDTAALAKAIEGQDIVFHLISASIPESSNRDPAADLSVNALGTVGLLDLCRAEKVRRVVFTSSGGTVYGIPDATPIPEAAPTNPISAYGITKLVIEKYLALYHHLYDLDYQVFRIANPYGRYQSAFRKQGVVSALIHRALTGKPLDIWGTGEVQRDFIHVSDVIDAILLCYDYAGPHRIMNVGSGIGRSINDIVRSLERLLGCGALPKRHRPGRAADVPVNVLDIDLITKETGWRPRVDWIEGFTDTVQWMAGDLCLTIRE